MSEQYGQTFTTTDGTNVTYIQFIDPSQAQLVYGNLKEEQSYYEEQDLESADGIIEESYIEEDDINVGEYEVLEEVIVEPKKSKSYSAETHHITKKLVQIKGWYCGSSFDCFHSRASF